MTTCKCTICLNLLLRQLIPHTMPHDIIIVLSMTCFNVNASVYDHNYAQLVDYHNIRCISKSTHIIDDMIARGYCNKILALIKDTVQGENVIVISCNIQHAMYPIILSNMKIGQLKMIRVNDVLISNIWMDKKWTQDRLMETYDNNIIFRAELRHHGSLSTPDFTVSIYHEHAKISTSHKPYLIEL